MSVAAIPLSVLIDSVTHYPLIQTSRGDTFGDATTINRVCVQSKNTRTVVDGSWISISGALMFWDASNSSSATFALGDKIVYTDKAVGEVTRYIKEITPCQDDSALHHIELMLI